MDILNNSPFDKALWIETFFDELIQGPYEVFWDAEYYPDSWDVTMTCDPPLTDVKIAKKGLRAVASKAVKVPVDKDAADTEATDVGAAAD